MARMEWIAVRLSATDPKRAHELLIHADRDAIDKLFGGAPSKPRVKVAIDAIELPLRQTTGITSATERFAAHLASGSTVEIDDTVRWTGMLISDGPAVVVLDLRMHCPLMTLGAPIVALDIAFRRNTIGATGEVVCKKAQLRRILSNGNAVDGIRLAPDDTDLSAIIVGSEFWLKHDDWRDAPILLQGGTLKTVVPANERFLRTLSFQRRGPVWSIAMAVHAFYARMPAQDDFVPPPAVVVGPLGIVAFDAWPLPEGFPKDLAAVQSPPTFKGKPSAGESWLLVHECHVTATLRPPNSDARPTRLWNPLVRDLHLSLDRVKGSDPASIAFEVDETDEHWRVTYDGIWDQTSGAWLARLRTVELVTAIDVNARFTHFRDHEGRPVSRALTVVSSALDRSDTQAWRLDLVVRERKGPPWPSAKVRIGALDVGFGTSATAVEGGTIALWMAVVATGRTRVIGGEALMRLGVESFLPAAQDAEEGRSSADGQVLVSPRNAAIAGNFVLSCSERFHLGESHSLSFGLAKQSDAIIASVPLIVLDTEPFLVARVDASLGNGAFIGNRSAGESWEFSDATHPEEATATLVLPPQGIGEEAVKRGVRQIRSLRRTLNRVTIPCEGPKTLTCRGGFAAASTGDSSRRIFSRRHASSIRPPPQWSACPSAHSVAVV